MFRHIYFGTILLAISLTFLSGLLSGCQFAVIDQNKSKLLEWGYSDLKLLDPIDEVIPDQDLIAAYARKNDHSIQIRLDFLDLTQYLGKDIYIPIDTNPGGVVQIVTINGGHLVSDVSWDYLLLLTAAGDVELIDNTYSVVAEAQLFIIYDSSQDRIIIDVSRSDLLRLFSNAKLEVIITPPGEEKIVDVCGIFSADDPSPARARVLFAFWNTFTSDTPAQTLRSWAGAHTGPMSSRHGLKYLIDVASRTHSTIFMLDLLTPNNVSALDYLNVLTQIQQLANKGILALPAISINGQFTVNEQIFSSIPDGYVSYNQTNPEWEFSNTGNVTNNAMFLLWSYYKLGYIDDKSFGDYGYAQFNNLISGCELTPTFEYLQQPIEDISLECKILLFSYANNQITSPLVLGGDFSKSVLGDPALSTEVFSYIAEHPWLQVLTIQDISTQENLLQEKIPLAQGNLTAEDLTASQTDTVSDTLSMDTQNKVYSSLMLSPQNQLTDLAWQMYYYLLKPVSPKLRSIQGNYVGQIGEVLTAANWAEAPIEIQSCDRDIDYDGMNECILANDQVFIVIEKSGGYIPFAFTKDAKGIHQVIGPTWEFIVGLSDPSSWDPTLGLRGDSAQILGAFQDQFNSWNVYNVAISDNNIKLFNEEMSMRKSISIYPDKIHIDIEHINQSQIDPIIPLVVDPWQRFITHWGDFYTGIETQSGYTWGIQRGEIVGINTSYPFTVYPFNESRGALSRPEDPNFDYSRGHYLPYPMALVEFSTSDSLSVDIVINP